MKIMCWNCRGAGHYNFLDTITSLVRINDPMLVFITETKQPVSGAINLRTRLNFDSSDGIDSIGLSGGIWAMWDSNRASGGCFAPWLTSPPYVS